MKRLIVLLFVAFPAFAQHTSEIVVKPWIEVAIIDTIQTILGSTTISSPTSPFASVDTDQVVWGRNVPLGTVVVSRTDSLVVLSKAATATDSTGGADSGQATLHFGYNASAAYTNGDWLGIPFEINVGPGQRILSAVHITDSSDVLDSTDVVFFNSVDFSPDSGVAWYDDNAALNLIDADFDKVVGYVSLITKKDFGQTRVLYADNLNVSLPPSGKLYGRLIVRQTAPNFTSSQCLTVRFYFTL